MKFFTDESITEQEISTIQTEGGKRDGIRLTVECENFITQIILIREELEFLVEYFKKDEIPEFDKN